MRSGRGRPAPHTIARSPASTSRRIVACALTIGACVSGPSAAVALDAHRSMRQYVHRVWQTEQGLPQNSVVAIAQTPDGYLWIGTQEGLGRFDGMRFSVFDATNTPALASNAIVALQTDRQGALWIGTENG